MAAAYPYTAYYYAAYVAAGIIYIGYAISLYRRTRALRERTPSR